MADDWRPQFRNVVAHLQEIKQKLEEKLVRIRASMQALVSYSSDPLAKESHLKNFYQALLSKCDEISPDNDERRASLQDVSRKIIMSFFVADLCVCGAFLKKDINDTIVQYSSEFCHTVTLEDFESEISILLRNGQELMKDFAGREISSKNYKDIFDLYETHSQNVEITFANVGAEVTSMRKWITTEFLELTQTFDRHKITIAINPDVAVRGSSDGFGFTNMNYFTIHYPKSRVRHSVEPSKAHYIVLSELRKDLPAYLKTSSYIHMRTDDPTYLFQDIDNKAWLIELFNNPTNAFPISSSPRPLLAVEETAVPRFGRKRKAGKVTTAVETTVDEKPTKKKGSSLTQSLAQMDFDEYKENKQTLQENEEDGPNEASNKVMKSSDDAGSGMDIVDDDQTTKQEKIPGAMLLNGEDTAMEITPQPSLKADKSVNNYSSSISSSSLTQSSLGNESAFKLHTNKRELLPDDDDDEEEEKSQEGGEKRDNESPLSGSGSGNFVDAAVKYFAPSSHAAEEKKTNAAAVDLTSEATSSQSTSSATSASKDKQWKQTSLDVLFFNQNYKSNQIQPHSAREAEENFINSIKQQIELNGKLEEAIGQFGEKYVEVLHHKMSREFLKEKDGAHPLLVSIYDTFKESRKKPKVAKMTKKVLPAKPKKNEQTANKKQVKHSFDTAAYLMDGSDDDTADADKVKDEQKTNAAVAVVAQLARNESNRETCLKTLQRHLTKIGFAILKRCSLGFFSDNAPQQIKDEIEALRARVADETTLDGVVDYVSERMIFYIHAIHDGSGKCHPSVVNEAKTNYWLFSQLGAHDFDDICKLAHALINCTDHRSTFKLNLIDRNDEETISKLEKKYHIAKEVATKILFMRSFLVKFFELSGKPLKNSKPKKSLTTKKKTEENNGLPVVDAAATAAEAARRAPKQQQQQGHHHLPTTPATSNSSIFPASSNKSTEVKKYLPRDYDVAMNDLASEVLPEVNQHVHEKMINSIITTTRKSSCFLEPLKPTSVLGAGKFTADSNVEDGHKGGSSFASPSTPGDNVDDAILSCWEHFASLNKMVLHEISEDENTGLMIHPRLVYDSFNTLRVRANISKEHLAKGTTTMNDAFMEFRQEVGPLVPFSLAILVDYDLHNKTRGNGFCYYNTMFQMMMRLQHYIETKEILTHRQMSDHQLDLTLPESQEVFCERMEELIESIRGLKTKNNNSSSDQQLVKEKCIAHLQEVHDVVKGKYKPFDPKVNLESRLWGSSVFTLCGFMFRKYKVPFLHFILGEGDDHDGELFQSHLESNADLHVLASRNGLTPCRLDFVSTLYFDTTHYIDEFNQFVTERDLGRCLTSPLNNASLYNRVDHFCCLNLNFQEIASCVDKALTTFAFTLFRVLLNSNLELSKPAKNLTCEYSCNSAVVDLVTEKKPLLSSTKKAWNSTSSNNSISHSVSTRSPFSNGKKSSINPLNRSGLVVMMAEDHESLIEFYALIDSSVNKLEKHLTQLDDTELSRGAITKLIEDFRKGLKLGEKVIKVPL